jgi:hypothetical protein
MTQLTQSRDRLQRRDLRCMVDDEAFEPLQSLEAPQRRGLEGVEAEDAQLGEFGEEAEIVAGRAVQAQHPKPAQRRDARLVLAAAVAGPQALELREAGESCQHFGVVAQAKTKAAVARSASRSSTHDALSKAKP